VYALREVCRERQRERVTGGARRAARLTPSTPGSYLAEGEWAQDTEPPPRDATIISPAGEKALLKFRDLAGAANYAALGRLPKRVAVGGVRPTSNQRLELVPASNWLFS
jgi:hypothetical protein